MRNGKLCFSEWALTRESGRTIIYGAENGGNKYDNYHHLAILMEHLGLYLTQKTEDKSML